MKVSILREVALAFAWLVTVSSPAAGNVRRDDPARPPPAAANPCTDSTDAPIVVATDATGAPPILTGGIIPADGHYLLSAVTIYNAAKPGTPSGLAGSRWGDRLRYSGSKWDSLYLQDGLWRTWGGTSTTSGNVLRSAVTCGDKAGTVLVDTYSSDGKGLLVLIPGEKPILLTFLRQ